MGAMPPQTPLFITAVFLGLSGLNNVSCTKILHSFQTGLLVVRVYVGNVICITSTLVKVGEHLAELLSAGG